MDLTLVKVLQMNLMTTMLKIMLERNSLFFKGNFKKRNLLALFSIILVVDAGRRCIKRVVFSQLTEEKKRL